MQAHRLALAAAIAVVLVAAAALAVRVVDVNRYRGPVERAVAARLGREVSLGPMRASLIPFGVRVEHVTIAEDSAFQSGRPFAQAEALAVRLRPMALLSGRIDVTALDLTRPSIELIRAADGQWNVATLGRGASDSSRKFLLDRLGITEGQIAVTDYRRLPAFRNTAPGTRIVYRNVDVDLRHFAPARPFDLDLSATLPDHGAQRLRIRGTAGPLNNAGIATVPFDGRVEFDSVSVSGLQRFLQVQALQDSDAIISGKADLRSSAGGGITSAGSLRFEQPRVRGVTLGYPVTATFDVAHDSPRDLLTIRSAKILLDRTPLVVDGTIDLRPNVPVLALHAAASDASLSEAARLASAFGVAFGSDMKVDGRVTADVRAQGPSNGPAFDGTLRLRQMSISGRDIPRPVRTQAVDVALTPDEIRSNDFTATTNGTSMSVRVTVARYTTDIPTVDASIRTTGAALADALRAARAWGIRVADDVSGTGRLTLNARATGPLHDPAMSGTGVLDDAVLKMRAAQEPLRVHHADLAFGSGGTAAHVRADRVTYGQFALDNVDAVVNADRGVVRVDPLTAGLFGGSHRGAIAIDTRRTPSIVTVASTLQGVDANRLATAVADMRDVIHGSLDSVAHVTFASEGGSLARTLNGTVSMSLPNGRVAHMDVLSEVGRIAKFVSSMPAGNGGTSVVAMKGTFAITQGVAATRDLTATIDGGRIGANGTVNLVNQALDLRMTAVLSSSYSRLVGGTQVGGFMGTVLANQRGELVVPMLVTGTLQQPRFIPDVQRIAEMKVRNMVPDLRDPQALAGAILGAIGERPAGTTGQKPAPPTAQPVEPAQQIQQMLEQLLHGKGKK